MKNKPLRIAVDFDGTLCQYAFPDIGEPTEDQIDLMNRLIQLREDGHKIILWTNRGDNEHYSSLSDAVNWCSVRGLEFDAINQNLPGQKKLSGPSPKIMADIYIDDLAVNVKDWRDVI
jgi:hypothetical protein